ncbi:flagella basal body P-ring formation protein FlgA [Luteimonas cucumeris]|uniref:Flagella basal body P-ring formation protein FlgA n=1 Tax=Luteimonas cucumeris TaxID=985012 RepID=A0A562L589_9GAMM|nr:flagellar basal body P-ring formation chaperone FlgA [Luteimonas cucumeris]TWI02830.1 flagella basal body P-ring formation protein FlgA [Luteimonas cucumeris]
MLRIAMLLTGLLAMPAAAATDFQPVESIRSAALAALALAPGADAEATLDPALRLPRCAGDLVARASSAHSVEVSCPQDAGWRLFVPVRVRRSQTVLVLSRGVGAGQVITADDFVAGTRDASRIVGAAIGDPAQALGQVARRSLSAGNVLSMQDLVAPRLVRRGDQVMLVSRRGGVEVRMAGKALADAGENERVTVESLSSRRAIQGVVGPDGDVWVNR